jgi:hypothetical protein
LNIATKLHDAGVFMDRKDWQVALLATTLGMLGALGGSLVAGYQHERVAARQAQLDRQTLVLNQILVRLLMPSTTPLAQRLAELNVQVVAWIKSFKHSLDFLKTQHEQALSLQATTQTEAQLKR